MNYANVEYSMAFIDPGISRRVGILHDYMDLANMNCARTVRGFMNLVNMDHANVESCMAL